MVGWDTAITYYKIAKSTSPDSEQQVLIGEDAVVPGALSETIVEPDRQISTEGGREC